jgi:hypothetical protein
MSADGIEQVRHSKGDDASHRELAPGMIGNMIAEITSGIRADDVSSRLAGAAGIAPRSGPAQPHLVRVVS